MITTITKAAIGATVAALAIPTTLILGAGTAHAEDGIIVQSQSAPGGVEVFIQTAPGDAGMSGWCTYTSIAQGNPIGKPAPALGVPFYIAPKGLHSARLWFPSYPTGATWNTTVSCPNGVASTQTFW